MRKLLTFMILLLLSILLYSNVQAEVKIRKGVQYVTETESDLTSEQLLIWMETNPVRIVAKGVDIGIYGKEQVIFMIFDIKGSDNSPLQIDIIRVLMHKNLKNIEDPLRLVGYTIKYMNDNTKSYKWNIRNDVYEEYDFLNKKFKKGITPDVPDVENEQQTNRKQLISN